MPMATYGQCHSSHPSQIPTWPHGLGCPIKNAALFLSVDLLQFVYKISSAGLCIRYLDPSWWHSFRDYGNFMWWALVGETDHKWVWACIWKSSLFPGLFPFPHHLPQVDSLLLQILLAALTLLHHRLRINVATRNWNIGIMNIIPHSFKLFSQTCKSNLLMAVVGHSLGMASFFNRVLSREIYLGLSRWHMSSDSTISM